MHLPHEFKRPKISEIVKKIESLMLIEHRFTDCLNTGPLPISLTMFNLKRGPFPLHLLYIRI